MSPILGIIASQNYPRITNSYESIATVTLGSAQSTVTFSSIPSTYKHLQIRCISKNTSADYTIRAQFNGDTGSNYSQHGLTGNGSSTSVYATAPDTNVPFGVSAGTATSVFNAAVIDILDASSTTKYKTTRALFGWDANGSGSVGLLSGSWRSTSAITSIVLSSFTGNFAQHSTYALYGIKS